MHRRIGVRTELEGRRERNLEIPIFPDGDFFGIFRIVIFIPREESQSFLKVVAERDPQGVQRGGLLFEDVFISFFPQRPKHKTRKKQPESIEEGGVEGAFRPGMKNVGYISHGFDPLAAKATLFPYGIG